MKRNGAILLGVITLAVIAFAAYQARGPRPETGAAYVIATGTPVTGFARATGPQPFDFATAQGPHPEYQTEWWYYTGNLETKDGRHFGYQLTFFRQALIPEDQEVARSSAWATNQVYFAHFTLSDVQASVFHEAENFGRGAAEIAGANAEPYHVWVENWSAESTKEGSYQLQAEHDGVSIKLTLHDAKGPILQGNEGYSQKGPDRGNASYYYSQTRLESSGTIQIGDQGYEVEGLSWMDHEYGTSALAEKVVGWDWFSIQLDDGSELMLFHLRREDGTVDLFSDGRYIRADGTSMELAPEDFDIEVNDTWRSPQSKATYPAEWTITIAKLDLTLHLEPYLADQELNLSSTYWEGAVQITGERDSEAISGNGYVEMTGYAESIQDKF